MPNIVYVLTNEAMPGLVKVGLTGDRVESRISQLSAVPGVPLPFECYTIPPKVLALTKLLAR